MAFKDFFEYEIKKLIDFIQMLLTHDNLELKDLLGTEDLQERLQHFQTAFAENHEMQERFLSSREVEQNHLEFAKECFRLAILLKEKNPNLAHFYATLGQKIENIGLTIFSFTTDFSLQNEIRELKKQWKNS